MLQAAGRLALRAVAAVLLAACHACSPDAPLGVDAGRRTPRPGLSIATIGSAPDLVNINFDNDTPGQPPSTGGPGQPTSIFSFFGTSVRVQASANGIATQPVVLTAQGAVQFAGVSAGFAPVAADVVRVEATVSFDRVADGWFLDTTAGSGPVLGALVTRLRMTEFGEIQDDVTRTRVGTYSPNQPLRVRVDIDMSAREWAASIDNEFDGFQDDPVVSGLPFVNGPAVTPTVGSVLAGLLVLSGGPTAVAYDDIRAFVLPSVVPVDVDVKPGSFPNSINPRSQGVLAVAILTTDTFGASTVEPTSVRFGPSGTEAVPVHSALEDADGDGDIDLLLHFRTDSTGIQCDDSTVMLTGTTGTGAAIAGSDSIRTVGCR